MLKIKILFEAETFLAVNKPAGLVVNRAETVKTVTLQDWMEKNYPSIRQVNHEEFKSRSGLVHRLDKETSGVLLLAKTPAAFLDLKNQFKARKVQKTYLALTHGRLEPKKGNINLPIARVPGQRGRFGIVLSGRPALTFYQVDQILSKYDQLYSLIEASPKTGRTHQIRVHFQHLGHPLVADPLYLGKRLPADLTWCPRLWLHTRQIEFTNPETGEKQLIKAPLAKDLKLSLKDQFNFEIK